MPLPRVLALTPFERPDVRLVAALAHAGVPAFLDAGPDLLQARRALGELAQAPPFGLRLPAPLLDALDPAELPASVAWLLLPAGAPLDRWAGRTRLVQVTSRAQALAAVEAGADGLVAKGWESGGAIGDETSLVLTQQLHGLPVPFWVQGGLGPHGAAAVVAGGARGVVLDDQLALVRETRTPAELREALATMDGSESTVADGVRTWTRPGRPGATVPLGTGAPVPLGAGAVPLGAGAGLAAPLARAHRTAAGVVAAVSRAIDEHLLLARDQRALAQDSALAAGWGLPWPIAQGPMTRVSDGPAFAQAVSDGGALPFVALALMRAATARPVLAETARRLAGRTWGVGMLGFAPPELYREQVELLLQIKPPVVLVAGGRPSQARALEDHGIETWLHVPSPGLLDLYLKEGARRFIFEGRESGGHVGPRGSLALWEAQVDRLLRFPALDEVRLLFAGGVHDGTSAAMVAALAAPLVARGARIGVLMGTAYLFTREAVATGAIQPEFQAQALACRRTAVLETAPGHATRCVDTPFVASFRAERERLEATGTPPKEVWAALEQLNLGRLRIAAKGLRREGPALVPVQVEEQRRDGLFMIGQVAALRGEVTTIQALHHDVCEGAVARLAAVEGDRPADPGAPAPQPVDIAIVGLACVFPDAPDVETFWAHVLDGHDAIRDVPDGRWSAEIFFDPQSRGAAGGQTYAKAGGWLPAIRFDPLAYGIPPRSLVSIEPVQLLALEIARRALADAGYEQRPFDRSRTAVIFGAEAGTELSGAYGFRTLYRQYVGALPTELDAVLPRFTEDSFPGVLANVISGRIANRLDLGGTNYTVDAACGSSLAAVDAAVKELVTGSADLVVAGGADLHNGINDYVLFSSVHALSRAGRARVFDEDADGTIIGEGVAAVVLKRLADAERDGDRIYAVIKGVGAASDGKSLGLTAPRREGQVRALERAWAQAGVPAERVGLVEAHGTGTVVGDKTELQALTEMFRQRPPGSIALGSVKSQIGHTKCAAGMAGLIKTALAVHHGVRPGTRNVSTPNAFWQADQSPFGLTGHARPWTGPARAAGVSAFGFGGTNFHVAIDRPAGALAPDVARQRWPAELFLFRGPDRAEALIRVAALRRLLDQDEPWRLRDLARSACAGGAGPVQVAVVAGDLPGLRARLDRALEGSLDPRGVFLRDERGPTVESGAQIAFLFPGQGSQRPGMLADLFVAFPPLQRLLALEGAPAELIFPPDAFTDAARAAQRAAVTDTTVAQPALGVAGLAMAELLARVGLRPDHLGGHSYGELVALCVAGAMDPSTLLRLSRARARRILDAAGDDPGAMAAVSATAEVVATHLADLPEVVLANHNAPDQLVLAGPSPAIATAVSRLSAAGLRVRPLPVACAFHSPVVADAARTFGQDLAAASLRPPLLRAWSNSTAAPHDPDPDALRARLAAHVALPVRFAEQLLAMHDAGARIFVEVGPGTVLTGLVDRVLADRPHLAVATDDGVTHGITRLLLALGALSVHGAPIDAEGLFEGRECRRFDLLHPPAPTVRPTDWLIDGHTARPATGELPDGAMVPVTSPVVRAPAAPQVGAPQGERERVVGDYLESMRRLVEAQREVMLGYLGATPAPRVMEGSASVLPATATVSPAPAPAPALPAAPPARASVQDVLLGIVSERTGYPLEMLDLDLDLEADLSIDSIKRIEILGVLGDQVGLTAADPAERDAVIEQLAGVRSLRGIVNWLEKRLQDDASVEAPAVPHPLGGPWAPEAGEDLPPDEETAVFDPTADPAADPAADLGEDARTEEAPRLQRWVVTIEPATTPVVAGPSLAGRHVLLADDGHGLAPALAARLVARGALARVVGPDVLPANGEDMVDLTALQSPSPGGTEPARHLFTWARAVAGGPSRRLLAVTGLGGDLGAPSAHEGVGGPAGLLKTVARERPELQVRVVDLDPTQDHVTLAGLVADELAGTTAGPSPEVEVGWSGGRRVRQVLRARPLTSGPSAVDLPPEAVVLITGGARGIAARAALALVQRQPCRLELVGRSPLPAPSADPELDAAADRKALRALLAARGGKGPREIEAACDRVLADREIGANLAALRAAGATVRYHALDVRDEAAFGALIDGLYQEHGRIDGVVHAAGVLEDRLLVHKTAESFDRVFDTKVKAARVIARKLRPGAQFVVFFGSVSGVLGNKGQVDYAAANDALDKLARTLNGRLARRVVAMDWGPWGGGGMVSVELEREYNRRGIGLIDPAEGARAFVEELLYGDPSEAQVLWMCGAPESLS